MFVPFRAQARKHDVGNIVVSVANNGSTGNLPWSQDACTGHLLGAIEFPKHSAQFFVGVELWVGGVRDGDTTVSVTQEFIHYITGGNLVHTLTEFLPAAAPEGLFVERTTRDRLALGGYCAELIRSPDARSEHDLISVATDTLTNPDLTGTNPYEQTKHRPLGIKLATRSYAWSYEYAADFVIVTYTLSNIGYREEPDPALHPPVEDLVIGVFTWASVADTATVDPRRTRDFTDDLVGRLETGPMLGRPELTDTLNMAWAADADGDPHSEVLDDDSPTSVFGVRVLSPYLSEQPFAFNWMAGLEHAWDPDWGPVQRHSRVQFERSTLGKPETDRGKYQLMTNGEVDYPQVETAMNHEWEGWLAPPSRATEIARGSHVCGLLSFGPYDLEYGDSITFAIAIVGGENLHTDPTHFERTFDPNDPKPFMDGLDFSDLIRNSQQAAWLYDSPGVDTDGDGYRGEYMLSGLDTIWYRGDGVPDFAGPPPPPPPPMLITTREGEVTIRFNGRRSETELDPYSHRVDFEGYRVYLSRTGRLEDYAMLAQRDLVNYARFVWNRVKQRWEMKTPPYTLDSLKRLYDKDCIAHYGHPFHPDSFGVKLVEKAFLYEVLDEKDPSRLDTFFYAFDRYEANQVEDDRLLAETVEAGYEVTGVIRKVYPDALISDTFYRDDRTAYLPYYEYEYIAKDLNVAEPLFFAITAFDHGDPQSALDPLESSPTANTQDIWPINSAEVVKSERPKPGVYPNPYKFSEYYNTQGWENPRGLEPDPERARKVTFFNVPDTCTVSIWSIDGDLVRRIEHRENPGNSQASVVIWNLITRNTQAVKTGIYLYSIESRFGVDTGKLVIIK
jgi:hypothetical protein